MPTATAGTRVGEDRLVLAGFVILILVVLAAGLKGIGLARPLFIAGCPVLAYFAWRIGPGRHVELAIVLFACAPLLRRVVDYSTGYDPNAVMLVGPLLALLVPLPELWRLVTHRGRSLGVFAPFALILVCITYGWALSAFQGAVMPGSIQLIKWTAPILYAMFIILRPDAADSIIRCAARAFMCATPVISVYGIYQYLHPPQWDSFWMIYTQMDSIGLPEPQQIRVFGTMNAPAGFAVTLSTGLLFFGFCGRTPFRYAAATPVCVALLLSMYRTAWIALAFGIVYCAFFSATRSRALLIALCLAGCSTGVVLLTPFGEPIEQRLATFQGAPTDDGSAQARLKQFAEILSDTDEYLLGVGLGGAPKYSVRGNDGQLISSVNYMGLGVGLLYIVGLVWACVQALATVRSSEGPLRVVAGAVVLGGLVALPLQSAVSAEMGFTLWTFVGVLSSRSPMVRPQAMQSRSRTASLSLSARQ